MPEAGTATIEPTAAEPGVAWHRALLAGLAAYVVSRICVAAGAAATVTANAIDPLDPTKPRPETATNGIIDVLTSWDGQWYLRIVRLGYPRTIQPDVTFGVLDARAAFFPLYPLIVRAADRVLPGGDVFAALFVNLVLGAATVYVVGLLALRLFDLDTARAAMVLTAMFPGSFVLSFAYSEATMLFLAALCLLWLLQDRWWLAGIAAALATASRPNGVAVIAACAVASYLAIRKRGDWRSLAAPVLAPLGWLGFQLFVGYQADEPWVWFRVQREAWNEGISFGATALDRIWGAMLHPASSPTNLLTLASVVAMLGLVYGTWKARLPAPVVAYTAAVLALMLLPSTVTARPRFLYTAFPLLIGFAAWFPKERWRDHWALLMAGCGAGLVALTAVYGAFGAIP
ncbi:MAG: glycosyltransferase family 39 protein [Acidimicrobiia bacterium]